jgi:hypothetical protein
MLNRRNFIKGSLAAVAMIPVLRHATGGSSSSYYTFSSGKERLFGSEIPQGRQRTVWSWLRMFQTGGAFSIPTSEARYKANLANIDVVIPTNGGILMGDGTWFQERWKLVPDWPQSLPAIARDAGHLYMPSMYNDREGVLAVLDDRDLQLSAAESLVELATSGRFDSPWDGVYLNLESIPFDYKDQMSDFLYLLYEKIKDAGLLVGLSVAARTEDERGDGYDLAVVNDVADYIDIRGYGFDHRRFGAHGSLPPSISPYWWVKDSIQFALENGIEPEKLTLGLANYSKYWSFSNSRSGGDITFAQAKALVAAAGATVQWIDENEIGLVREHFATINGGHLWIHDTETFQWGLDLIEQYGLLGGAIFAVGMGNDAQWRAIHEWRYPNAVYLPRVTHSPFTNGTIPPVGD